MRAMRRQEPREVTRKVWPVTGTVELCSVSIPGDGGAFRRALVYPVGGGPDAGTWRLRIELFPENGEAASGWHGGRVQWHRDAATADEVEPFARLWVENGIIP